MDNNKKDPEEPQNEVDDVTDLKESIREMKQEIREQMRELREELGDFKEDFPPPRRPRKPRPPRPPRGEIGIRIDKEDWEDWGERFGKSFEHYIGGILDSIGETIDRSVGSIFHPPSARRERRWKGKRKEPFFVPEEELEEFYTEGSKIAAALSDQTRLRMLKELEKEPLRQSDLSEKTNTRGGNFKHHITILKDEGLVRQEGVRERYMLTYSGREALKLVEFLYSRGKKRIPIPVYATDEEEEDILDEEE
ncbi:MAG: winged helix-turn-helix transcriptional regulator [Candidatus Heimdallarchaeota archaeon]|nr:MAG: winged helix-turn-helix transcriptional regulator [Candidatus Heimdallarchaeota archaeon]